MINLISVFCVYTKLETVSGKRSDVAVCHDFHAANDPDKYYPSNPAFKVKRISKYGTQVHLSDANVIAHFATINYN